MKTLGSQILRLEQADFVGRARELAAVARGGVFYLHGPSGIGKSVLMREIARAIATSGPRLLIDDFDASAGPELRARLASEPADAFVVIASREPPDAGWHEGGWETVMCELPLEPFTRDEAGELLARLGLGDDPRRDAIIAWASGMPRSLRLGASAALADPDWRPGAHSAAMCAYLRRIVAEALASPYAGVFALACTTDVTHALIAERFPDLDAAAALRWLAGYGVTEIAPLRPHLQAELRAATAPAIDPEAVREALRTLHVPGAPAAVSRERLEEAAEHAFGETPDEQLLRRVLIRGYFEPAGSHEAAARELHLSRAAYFRRLRSASERVAAYLVTA